MIIPLYIVIPIISAGVKKIPFCFVLVICAALFYLFFFIDTNSFSEHINLSYFLYLLLGYVIYILVNKNYRNIFSNRQITALGFVKLFIFLVVYFVAVLNQVKIYHGYYWYYSLYYPVLSFLLFFAIYDIFNNLKENIVLRFISNISLGMYLYHFLFVSIFLKIIKLGGFAYFITIFHISFAISLIAISLISVIPYVGNLLVRADNYKLILNSKLFPIKLHMKYQH